MSVLIKGMQIPENCTKCGLMCALRHFNILNDNRPDNCPLVELPERHGRLIDADELKTAFPRCDNNKDIKIASVRATINHMPPIIEAEGAEE